MEAPTNDDIAPTPSKVFSAFLLFLSIANKESLHNLIRIYCVFSLCSFVGVRGIKALVDPSAVPRVFLVVASMVLTTMIVAIASTFTNNHLLLITTGALAIATALTTITTAILITKQ